jgi:hypothetical protein
VVIWVAMFKEAMYRFQSCAVEHSSALFRYQTDFCFADLLDDLGANDTFVIDGDSLLLELLASVRMDWSHGGQFLQLVAAAEKLVASINHANTADLRFSVVFFEASAAVQPDAAARMARLLLRRWLPERLHVPVLQFHSWWGDDWLAWLSEARPALLLMTDMTDMPQPTGSTRPPGDSNGAGAAAGAAANGSCAADGDADGSSVAVTRQQYMRAFLLHSAAQGLQCALLTALRFTENFMFAFRTLWRGPGQRCSVYTPAMAAARAVAETYAQRMGKQLSGSSVIDGIPLPPFGLDRAPAGEPYPRRIQEAELRCRRDTGWHAVQRW